MVGRAAVVLGAVALVAALLAEHFAIQGRIRPRPRYDLPRTAAVLDAADAAYLAALHERHAGSWRQSYFNLLVRRWSERDARLGGIFRKVVDAANRLSGGGGDYVITNDFFSLRAPGVVQFAPEGFFHMDCDFWKIGESDGFNLWVLLEHSDLPVSFEVAERSRNPELYAAYDGSVALHLRPENRSDPGSAFSKLQSPPLRFCSGHEDILNWRVASQVLGRSLWRSLARRWKAGRGRRRVPAPNVTSVELRVGEALVLQEQELHRTDLHAELRPGQRRLAVGFKMQRRGAKVVAFDPTCTAQKDRMNLPDLWERIGEEVRDVYLQGPRASSALRHLSLVGRWVAVVEANMYTLFVLLIAGVSLGPLGFNRTTGVAPLTTALGAWLCLLAGVAWWQREWLAAAASAHDGEGGRLRSALAT